MQAGTAKRLRIRLLAIAEKHAFARNRRHSSWPTGPACIPAPSATRWYENSYSTACADVLRSVYSRITHGIPEFLSSSGMNGFQPVTLHLQRNGCIGERRLAKRIFSFEYAFRKARKSFEAASPQALPLQALIENLERAETALRQAW